MRRLTRSIATAVASSALALAVGMSPAAAITATQYDAEVIGDTNIHRSAHGLVRLSSSACLNDYAQSWARSMASRKTLVHRSSASMRTIMSRCGLSSYGENIAQGYPTGHKVVSAWMKSPGHRANILRSSYRLIAVGVSKDSSGRWWAVQAFGRR